MSQRATPAATGKARGRQATIARTTKETKVECTLRLDGSGQYDVQTDNKFLTHMVETWTRYAGFDVRLRATGDLDHHLVEDVAISLGQAFKEAFAHAPCVRIAYDFVPMDDALVLCAVDLVDRPYYEGQLPVPLWEHFFRSFAMEARINLHLEHLRGRDTHHTIEASVKAFARALKRALEPREAEISTKGVVKVKGAKT
ncbi:MAG: imidazoleglycerol-phosphate dehydratase [Thermoplasmata archaeon]|nr:imidazoleglycerol-phosphate dehydratase [Thermoplasmata archaeon]